MPMGLPTQIPGAVIEAAHHNNVADRIVGRFATNAELAAAVTAPVTGMVASVAGRPYVYSGGAWRTVSQQVRVYGASVALNPVPPSGALVIPQTNFTMPTTGLVTMSYQISLAAIAGGSLTTIWQSVIEGTGFTSAGVSRAQQLPANTLVFLSGTHTFEVAGGAKYGRVLVSRVSGDLAVQSFASAYGIEISY